MNVIEDVTPKGECEGVGGVLSGDRDRQGEY